MQSLVGYASAVCFGGVLHVLLTQLLEFKSLSDTASNQILVQRF